MSFEKINVDINKFKRFYSILVSETEALFFYKNKRRSILIQYCDLLNKIEKTVEFDSPLFEQYFVVIEVIWGDPIFCCKYDTNFLLVAVQSKNDGVKLFLHLFNEHEKYIVSVSNIIFESSLYDENMQEYSSTIFLSDTMDVVSYDVHEKIILQDQIMGNLHFSIIKDGNKIHCFIREDNDSSKYLYCIEYDYNTRKRIDFEIVNSNNKIDMFDKDASIIIVFNGKFCVLSRFYSVKDIVYIFYLHKNYLIRVDSLCAHLFGNNILAFLKKNQLFVPIFDFNIRNVVIKTIEMPLLRHHLLNFVLENDLNYLIKDLWQMVSEYYSFTKFI